MQEGLSEHCMLSGDCPDEGCQTKLYFPSYDKSIECTNCGQRHVREALQNIQEVTNMELAFEKMVHKLLVGSLTPKKTTDSVKVLGLSNYQCKLLSPLLTYNGMDKQGKAKPLENLNKGKVFDCAIFGDRAFLINPDHIDIMGFGRDQTGGATYLQETLDVIKRQNNDTEVLIPVHADGDGHCLVHGVSRALIGRELFWHALRTNLKNHLVDNLDKYQMQFQDFFSESDWDAFIRECDPDFVPGPDEVLGLRNLHVFGLANVLHRPIILLDSLEGLHSAGECSGVFLPIFHETAACSTKGILNKPLCIAWSSSARNHFIALVGVKGRPLPKLPRWMLKKAWGVSADYIDQYIDFDESNMCTIGGERTLPEKYVRKLATAMEELFLEIHKIHPSLVADVHDHIYKRTGIIGVKQEKIIETTKLSVETGRLYRCLTCNAVSESNGRDPKIFKPGGELYDLAESLHGKLQVDKRYSFLLNGLICTYDEENDELVPEDSSESGHQCPMCRGNVVRLVNADGSVVYQNGDRTLTVSNSTKCTCGFKHFWEGREYDNHPYCFSVDFSWKGQKIEETVAWFQDESDPSLNSNAFQIATSLVQKYFPGEFGSENVVQNLVASILQNTAKREQESAPISLSDMPCATEGEQTSGQAHQDQASSSPSSKASKPSEQKHRHSSGEGALSPRKEMLKFEQDTASKIILTGQKKKTLHKEELTMSEAEQSLQKTITCNAEKQQSKASSTTKRQSTHDSQHQVFPKKADTKQSEERTTKNDSTQSKSIDMESSDNVKDTLMTSDGTTTKSDLEQGARKKVPMNKIRLTSDGVQTTLTIATTTTFHQFQQHIEDALHIPAPQQRIKYGYPPKEMKPPQEGAEQVPLSLQNGDRVMVEIIKGSAIFKEVIEPAEHPMETESEPSQDIAHITLANTMLQKLQQSAADDIDIQVSSLALMATLLEQDLWDYVQTRPELFQKDGLYYKLMERDLGLVDKKHFTLPSINNKKFVYNEEEDQVEICLEPIGHFAITSGVDDPQRLAKLMQESLSTTSENQKFDKPQLLIGGSGMVSSSQSHSRYVAFGGHGHTLASTSEDIRNDTLDDLPTGAEEEVPKNESETIAVERKPGKNDNVENENMDTGCGSPAPGSPVPMDQSNSWCDQEDQNYLKPKKLGPAFTVLTEDK
ncbi:deubiquitinating protein VCIP135-like [Anneissia japonica]|uniref:deubiquitinating protein VCIP135-like n=1 Tax=Anneissia japonica TaxID=1529436 RepID=UPI0014257B6B|nr:deubiquitinating protein VCIP135-like [Anneissia japonica]XP_033112609.1 deubiquitinating protein VCIP135-like [Anneissia japonica]